jgi:4-hydroxyphenylacetate 3-monooxygenase
MGARSGRQVLERLREHVPELWHRGERVEDVTTHPAFKNGVNSLAELYDIQLEQPEVMLFPSPSSGAVGARS